MFILKIHRFQTAVPSLLYSGIPVHLPSGMKINPLMIEKFVIITDDFVLTIVYSIMSSHYCT